MGQIRYQEPHYGGRNIIRIVNLETYLTYLERKYVSVQTICLPPSGLHIRGDEAAAVGWGRYLPNFIRKRRGLSNTQSKTLRYVRLRVSDRPFRNEKMFGTLIPEDATHENVKDACAGDSGG